MKMVICGLRLVLNDSVVSMSIWVIPRPGTGSNHPKGGYTCLGSRSQPRATSSKNPGRYWVNIRDLTVLPHWNHG